MTAGRTPPLHVLRSILRHIRTAPKQEFPTSSSTSGFIEEASTSSCTSHPLFQQVMSQYRAAQSIAPKSREAIMMRKMAYDFHILKSGLRERGLLHELDGGAEIKLSPKEMSRRAAARAGLQLPETYGN
mmetsp:Transcript_4325/g.6602  ORF Transcript_4325/g.6602 Transcript_4325/m.6602 type:complete len:129 (-) Transcript_4325:275-661(-)|eukprot:CAMPEP_0197251140 /NCGR_PEP_ID=MMETSP1429-20130617/55934_1 /TAXON_ID=49237 /ORGANISM="Chaetoceros  sp., Strain UNC1202" /LENGTH=128 /DNA_ID=CAMNT_0042713143 /DNA_START=34 /DNA_END=420 /DNA_ORIENTATION=-